MIKEVKSQLLKRIAIGVGISELIGISGGLFTVSAIPTWYAGLAKPWFNPPNWLFGPAWTLLYLLMGISFGLVWNTETDKNKDQAYSAFYIQLVLNFLWSGIFFGLRQPFLAFLEMLILGVFVAVCLKEFERINKTAGYLMIPYLAWISFAALLNLTIVILNF